MYNKCIKAHYVSLIDINNISHKLNYTKFSIIITPKLNFSREKNVMSKNKLLIYLLSTTLVFPTFTTPTAVAKDNTDDINQQTKVTHKSSQSKEDKQEQTDSNQRAHQAEKASSEKSPSKENGKSSKTHNKDNDVKADKNKTSNQSDQNSNQQHQTTTAVTDQNKQKIQI